MHRDTKLGLALGILLIGIVGALFFRHDADPEADVPQLDDPHALDEQIAEQPLAPYLTGIETDASGARDAGRGTQEDSSSLEPDSLSAEAGDVGRRTEAIPDPISPQEEGRPGSPFKEVSVPKHNESWKHNEDWTLLSEQPADQQKNAAGQSSRSKTAPQPSTSAAFQSGPSSESDESLTEKSSSQSHVRFYRVRKGDTLSELASRFLGSSAKYREIFEVNRDVLKTPDDLRAGMTIRIPVENGSPSAGTVETGQAQDRTRSISEEASWPQVDSPLRRPASARKPKHAQSESTKTHSGQRERPEDETQRRFIPVRRFPFVPRRD